MRFTILGPVRMINGEREAVVAAGRCCTVLAALLLEPGRVVPVSRLTEAVWPQLAPPTARSQLHTCVSRLRRCLRGIGLDEDILQTGPDGYLVGVGPDDLDAHLCAGLVAEARSAAAAGRLSQAQRLFRSALALWRGPALTGASGPLVELAAGRLEEQRWAAIEDRVAIDLRLGDSDELLGELTELVKRQPLRERLRGQLMLALHRAGRDAEALAVFGDGRRLLAAELGLHPGAELEELYRRIRQGGQ
jgi:DNA-binding SARP family transcriptional activator